MAFDEVRGTTSRLADFVATLHPDRVPDDVAARVRRQVLDLFGVALAGSREPAGQIASGLAARTGGRAEAAIWGTSVRTPAMDSAFANGVAAHALDFDDYWLPGNHPSAPIVPAAMAVAESVNASGRALVTALTAGYEVMGRLSAAVSGRAGWHPTGVFGVMGATAAAARLLNLDAERTATAFGIASSHACGIDSHEGTMTKPLHAGLAARNGVAASLLAADGFTANPTVFDEGRGFFASFFRGMAYDPWRVTVGLGDAPFYLMSPGIGIKAYPAGYLTHHAFEAALEIVVKNGLSPDDIDEVVIGFQPGSHFNRPQITSGLEGKFSLQYVVALAILDRALGVDSFSDDKARSQPVQRLLGRMRAHVDERLPKNRDIYTNPVTVTTTDGRRYTAHTSRPQSHWSYPLSDQRVAKKFLDNAGPVLGERQAGDLLSALNDLESLPSVRVLADLLMARSNGPVIDQTAERSGT